LRRRRWPSAFAPGPRIGGTINCMLDSPSSSTVVDCGTACHEARCLWATTAKPGALQTPFTTATAPDLPAASSGSGCCPR
jgi:hypothetical protein